MPPVPPRDHRLSLGASLGLAVVAAVIIGTATAVIMYQAESIWFYAYILVGVAIGSAVNYRARPATWRTRSYLAAAIALVTLFVSHYFLLRADAIRELRNNGFLAHGQSVPLILSGTGAFRVVGDYLKANPIEYFIWGFAIYLAYRIPSYVPRTAAKRGIPLA